MAALCLAIEPPARVVAQSGERTLSIHNIHTKETVTAVYKRNGRFIEAGLRELNHVMRDHRRNEETRMDPELIDLLWEIHHELGSKEPIHLISGYRSRATNELLRKTSGGQASESRHILGKAADVHFPDVPLKHIRYSALIHEKGGVGYYPTSALPFVHVDTDRVRSWPRLPRHELALLFPSGSTQHAAADGGSITREDVQIARARHADVAQQVAQFQNSRIGGGAAVTLADARRPHEYERSSERVAARQQPVKADPPALIEPLKPATRPNIAALAPRLDAVLAPSTTDRARLAELAGLVTALPQLLSGPLPARRPDKPSLPSLTGNALNLPPSAVEVRPAAQERQVASLGAVELPGIDAGPGTGRFGWGVWVPAPAYDDEHPEELSYRPFPIVPYLTESATQSLMSELVAHDPARTVEMLDQPEPGAMLSFRPTVQAAGNLWELTFTGAAVGMARLGDSTATSEATLSNRPVRTSQR